MFKRILLAYDGSEGAKLALGKAAEMATAFAAELHILAVGRIPEYAETVSEVEEAREQAKGFYSRVIEEALHGLKERGLAGQSRIDFGKPGDVILRIAEDLSVDLIIGNEAALSAAAEISWCHRRQSHRPCTLLRASREERRVGLAAHEPRQSFRSGHVF